MAKKRGYDYFEAMADLAKKSNEAAVLLQQIVSHYEVDEMLRIADQIHTLEREGDEIVAQIMSELNHSFITPIDREDIVLITELLDDILDGINSIPYQFDNFIITKMRPKTEEMANFMVAATAGVAGVTAEFSKFKNSKSLGELISEVNRIESETDCLYSSLLKELFSKETDVLEVIKWKELFRRFENVVDMSEKAVDVLAGLVIKNS